MTEDDSPRAELQEEKEDAKEAVAKQHDEKEAIAHEVRERQQVDCCIVGGGPGGAMLALLLARKGIRVMLLEAHEDFDRDFRGDTLHPSVLEIMEELGLSERLHQLRHSKIDTFTFMTPDGPIKMADFNRLKTRFPYIMMVPQSQFLELVTKEARKFPNFQLVMSASAQELMEEGGRVQGVRYRSHDGWREVRATLTVGADGRSSRMRRLGGFVPVKTSPPMDILWFRLPRLESDGEGAMGRFGRGHIVVMLDRLEQWQMAYVILKGSFQEIREEGLEALRRSISDLAPELADRVALLKDWKQVSMLSVESSRVPRWYKPGLLLIGDAAHVMSPVGGVGINYAIQDAVAAANLLTLPLKRGEVTMSDLDAVQRRREWPTRIIQRVQTLVQQNILASGLDPTRPFRLPLVLRLILRLPVLRNIPARLIAFGFWPAHLRNGSKTSPPPPAS
ncbi:MAG TPA: FAD-dependent oxidoreductase [Pyrinomonadaceae bacterium]|jgi:2-polyprenyl-6-methoxyphenol hydroxylase-like FAD-dependent oxidoreductase|nr:FAD-dependent oxidoreductase [Pyrinomonadaceae bacterium]